jgi:hypothetical protein
MRERLVRHYQHTSERLCTRQGDAMRAGIRRFFTARGWTTASASGSAAPCGICGASTNTLRRPPENAAARLA